MIIPKLKTVIIRIVGSHCTITLNRPDKRNALNNQLIVDLKEAFNFVKSKSNIKIISLKSNGVAFCSGADISQMQTLKTKSFNENVEDSTKLAELFMLIYNFPKPVIAIINGPALAGGCGLASVCDIVLATTNAKFGYPEVKIGFVAAMVLPFLIRQVGERVARFMLITGKTFTAQEAFNMGLVNEVCDSKIIEDKERNLVLEITNNSSQAMEITKQIISDYSFKISNEIINSLAIKNADSRKTDDFLEGVNSFLEKRKPNWLNQQ